MSEEEDEITRSIVRQLDNLAGVLDGAEHIGERLAKSLGVSVWCLSRTPGSAHPNADKVRRWAAFLRGGAPERVVLHMRIRGTGYDLEVIGEKRGEWFRVGEQIVGNGDEDNDGYTCTNLQFRTERIMREGQVVGRRIAWRPDGGWRSET